MRFFPVLGATLVILASSAEAFGTPQLKNNVNRRSNTSLKGIFDGDLKAIGNAISTIFEPQSASKEKEEEKFPDVVIDPSFKLPAIFLTLGILLDFIPYIQLTLGPFVTLLGVLFLVQTFRLRFCFDETSFELRLGDNLANTGENIVVGGENRWAYDSFVNWEFFPKGWVDTPQGPILAYFKETQTPSDKWNEGPGKSANSEEAIANGAVPGQVHFFPVLCDAKQLRAEFQRRKCAKL